MRHILPSRVTPAAALRLALPLSLVLASGCSPDLPPGGYAAVSHRAEPTVPVWSHPDPPPVTPGLALGGGGEKIVARNLPAGVTQAMVDEGQSLYGGVCSACHGPGGAGSTVAPPLNDREWLNIGGAYPEVAAIIKAGVAQPKKYPGAMPPRGGGAFTDEQVNQIAAYVYALSQQGES